MSSPCQGCTAQLWASRGMLFVQRPEDLRKLLFTYGWYDSVQIVGLEPKELRELWEQRLIALYSDCGCTAGGAAALAGLVGYSLYSVRQAQELAWVTMGGAVLTSIAGAVAGKLMGIIIVRVRLWLALREFQLVFREPV